MNSDTEALLVASLGARYKLEGLLGRGGMGAVYKALDTSLDRTVAIKVLPPELARDDTLISRFQREARIAAKLDHPGVIPVYAVEKGDGVYFFVMKYVSGKALDALIRSGPLPIDFCQRILWECATALGHAHQRGVVHRDIKPANIILDEAGRAVITDFGISKALQATTQLTATGAILGTPYYMSPEQAKGFDTDGRGDQYSLAMAGYHMLTGQVPFGDFPLYTVIYKQIFEAPTPIPELRPDTPEFLVKAIARGLAKDPEDRFATMEDFATAVLPEHPVTADGRSTISWPTVGTRAGSRRRIGILTGASVVVAAVLAGVLWFANRRVDSVSTDAASAPPAPVDSVARGSTPGGPVTVTPDPSSQPSGPDSGSAARRTGSPPATSAAVPPTAPVFAFLTINSDPFGTVFVDGVELGDVPVVNHRLTPGRRIIEIRREGFHTVADTIDVVAGNPIRLSKRLIKK